MPLQKSNLLKAAEWLWSNRRRNLWWGPDVLTEANKGDKTAPKMTAVEARSVFTILEERALIFPAPDGGSTYHLHEAKETEWNAFLSELGSGESLPKAKATATTDERVPDITEPWKFASHHIAKNYQHLRAAWIAVGAITVIAFLAGWLLAWNVVVVAKDATIEQWRTSKEIADKDNERLSLQIGELKTYRSQDALPLKKKALILAQQIREFTVKWKDSDAADAQSENVRKYVNRFGLRAQIMRNDLDQSGQHSDVFDKVMDNFSSSYEEVRTIATEIERLAKNLPD